MYTLLWSSLFIHRCLWTSLSNRGSTRELCCSPRSWWPHQDRGSHEPCPGGSLQSDGHSLNVCCLVLPPNHQNNTSKGDANSLGTCIYNQVFRFNTNSAPMCLVMSLLFSALFYCSLIFFACGYHVVSRSFDPRGFKRVILCWSWTVITAPWEGDTPCSAKDDTGEVGIHGD